MEAGGLGSALDSYLGTEYEWGPAYRVPPGMFAAEEETDGYEVDLTDFFLRHPALPADDTAHSESLASRWAQPDPPATISRRRPVDEPYGDCLLVYCGKPGRGSSSSSTTTAGEDDGVGCGALICARAWQLWFTGTGRPVLEPKLVASTPPSLSWVAEVPTERPQPVKEEFEGCTCRVMELACRAW